MKVLEKNFSVEAKGSGSRLLDDDNDGLFHNKHDERNHRRTLREKSL